MLPDWFLAWPEGARVGLVIGVMFLTMAAIVALSGWGDDDDNN